MAKLKHVNLFVYGDEKKDVYDALQRDFDRDTRRQGLWHYALVGCAAGAALVSNHLDWLWLFGGIYAAERALATFIDNSNRNWLMHAVDWFENRHTGNRSE